MLLRASEGRLFHLVNFEPSLVLLGVWSHCDDKAYPFLQQLPKSVSVSGLPRLAPQQCSPRSIGTAFDRNCSRLVFRPNQYDNHCGSRIFCSMDDGCLNFNPARPSHTVRWLLATQPVLTAKPFHPDDTTDSCHGPNFSRCVLRADAFPQQVLEVRHVESQGTVDKLEIQPLIPSLAFGLLDE